MNTENLDVVLLFGAAVLLVAVAAVRISTRSGLPSLLIYLGIGVLIGEAGFGVDFDDAQLTQILGICALVVILAEGGLTTRWSAVRSAAPMAVVVSTVGVGVSVAVIAVVAHYGLDLSWRLALLTGAVISSTDAAAVFSTLRRLRLPRRLVGTLEMESGLNDAPVVILVSLLTTGAFFEEPPLLDRGHDRVRAGRRRGTGRRGRVRRASGYCGAARCRPPASTRSPP